MSQAFAPFMLGNLALRNRIIRSSTNDPLGNPGGTVSEEQIALNRRLAENQVGLILSGMASVAEDGLVNQTQNRLHVDSFIPGHRAVTEAVHAAGGKVVLQINHCGAASAVENPMSPSGVPYPFTKAPCREMTKEEIKRVTRDFVDTALRGKAAGYDGIQIHCAHGYLLSQFINPVFNKRTDEYGGNVENRFRFAAEVIAAVREAVGADYFLSIKINSNIEENDESFGPELQWIGRKCKELGVDFIEVSGWDFTPRGRAGEHNYFLERAAALRADTGIPVALIGGVRTLEDIDQVLSAGVDMVSLCRPFICQEDLVLRFLKGEAAACVSCSKCFVLGAKYRETGIRCKLHQPAGG